ncbi:MAG: hypothetical protein WBX19_01535 [Terracidiphilus sp.]
MRGDFQKLLVSQDGVPAVLSLNVQAAMGPVREPERSQFVLLMRHFLERFFNHETASADGDGKTRLVQLAFAAGLPGFVVALYLWPLYHPFPGWPPGSTADGPPPYWAQLNHHFFFVMYSFVVMGLIAVFEWDLFFPDLIDVFVLGTLPVAQRRVFIGRVAAIGIFVAGFLFDANFLGSFMLPVVADSPHIAGFLAGHVAAVAAGGLFAAVFIVALQSTLLAMLGERLFSKISLLLQGSAVAVLVMLLLLFPVLSGVTPALLRSNNSAVLWFPPFWFLGMYQTLLDGTSALPIFRELSEIGLAALFAVAAIAVAAYPLAYVRRVKFLLEGAPPRSRRNGLLLPLNGVLHAGVVRRPIRRAVFHFINQTLFRVPRYRIYLVLYGGVGLSVLIATVLRLSAVNGQLRAEASADGIRVAVGIVAFWVTTGLRTAFVSPGNQRGSWIFRLTHGRPVHFVAAMDELTSAKLWVLLCAVVITEGAVGALRLVAPAELTSAQSTTAQILVGAGICVILSDAFFTNVMIVPFTGEAAVEKPNIAFTLLKFFTFFPAVTAVSLISEQWIEQGWQHFGLAAIAIVVIHLWFSYRHRETVRIHSAQAELEEGEDDFPMRLGLRY